MELLTRLFDKHDKGNSSRVPARTNMDLHLRWHLKHIQPSMPIADFVKLHVRIHCCIEVFLQWNSDGATEEVKDDDVGDVELGEEPSVVLGPVRHDRMPREQRSFGKFSLCGVLGYGHHAASEDDVGTPRIHWVVVLLSAVVALKNKSWAGQMKYD